MLLSYNTWSMPTVPIAEAIKYCAQVGYDSMELAICPGWPTDAALLDRRGRREVQQLFVDNGIALAGLTGNTAIMGPQSWSESFETLKMYLDFAAEIQRPGESLAVSTTAGSTRGADPGLGWRRDREELVERFGEVAGYATSVHALVAIEPHVYSTLRRPEQARWLIEQVGLPSLRVNLDISHGDVQGIPSSVAVGEVADYLVGTEVKDQRGKYPDFEFLVPGEGTFDYVEFLEALKRAGFTGSVSVEVGKVRQAVHGFDPLQAAVAAYAVLSRAFEEAGIDRRESG